MKHTILLVSILVFVGAGCVNQSPAALPDAPSETSLEVPALGLENVVEMVVIENTLSKDLIETENVAEEMADEASQVPEAVSLTIVARQWAFEPPTIRVREGQRVELTIQSVDVSHGFSLSAFNVNEQLEPGQTVRVSFVANQKGSFPFFCNVFCGQGHSLMRGTLIVE